MVQMKYDQIGSQSLMLSQSIHAVLAVNPFTDKGQIESKFGMFSRTNLNLVHDQTITRLRLANFD